MSEMLKFIIGLLCIGVLIASAYEAPDYDAATWVGDVRLVDNPDDAIPSEETHMRAKILMKMAGQAYTALVYCDYFEKTYPIEFAELFRPKRIAFYFVERPETYSKIDPVADTLCAFVESEPEDKDYTAEIYFNPVAFHPPLRNRKFCPDHLFKTILHELIHVTGLLHEKSSSVDSNYEKLVESCVREYTTPKAGV